MAFIAVGDKKVADTTPDLTPYALAQDVEEAFENVVSVEDIAKEITSESTDDEVASAKAVFDELADKADKNYGAENKGKMLVVGEDGEITPDEPTLSTVAMTKNAWQIYDKSKLKDGQEVIITDDDSAEGVIDDSEPRGDATYSSQKIEDKLGEAENIPKLTNFDNAVPKVGKTKVYYVNSGIGFGTVGQWRVESTLYDVTGNNQLRGCQRATSIDGVNAVEAIRVFYIDDSSGELKFGTWKQLI